jgi:hypothetical protein
LAYTFATSSGGGGGVTGQGLMSGCIRSMVSALLFISTSFFSAIF